MSAYVSIRQHTSAPAVEAARSRTIRVLDTATPSGQLPRICMFIFAPIRLRHIHVYACVYMPRICMHIYAAPRSSVEHCVCVYIYGRSGSERRTTVPSCSASKALDRAYASTTVKESSANNAGGVEHLRAQPPKKHVQAIRRVEHLRAQPSKKQLQAMRKV